MTYFAGLDVSTRSTSVCVIADDGEVVLETSVATEPEAIAGVLRPYRGTLMRLAHRQAEAGLVPRRQDQVHVVGHQAVGPDLHPAPARLFGEEVPIDLLIAILEEDRLAAVAALGDMMRQSGNNHAGKAGHPEMLASVVSQFEIIGYSPPASSSSGTSGPSAVA